MADLDRFFPKDDAALARTADLSFSESAQGMLPSAILTISYAVRERIEAGAEVTQFTVGDFDPKLFPVPAELKAGIIAAVEDDQTNYPPAHGTPELRQAIRDLYARTLGLDYPLDSVVVCAGARGIIYSAVRCLVSPGEKVVTPTPGWNNDYFSQLAGADHVQVTSRPEDSFMPTAEALAPHLDGARLLVICSPMNPAGTMIRREQLEAICEQIVSENARREANGERLLYLVYDQVYRMLTFGDIEHVTPFDVVPEMARYTLFTDAISKSFAATGLRVGWLVGPPQVAAKVKALMTHVGGWAARPIQLGTAELLNDDAAMDRYLAKFKAGLEQRLTMLYDATQRWKAEGLPVDAIAPQGAIYLSVRFDLEGRPGFPDADAVRLYLLNEAGCAIVPFSAFGDTVNKGWVRFSVGAVGEDEMSACLPRIEKALRKAVS